MCESSTRSPGISCSANHFYKIVAKPKTASKTSSRTGARLNDSAEPNLVESTSATYMRHLTNKYGNCNLHEGKCCFVRPDGTHRHLTIAELTLWAISIVSLILVCLLSETYDYIGIAQCNPLGSS